MTDRIPVSSAGGRRMKRAAVLAMTAMLFSCGGRAGRSLPPASTATAPLIFASMQAVTDIRVGSIHNRIMGLEGEIPSAPVSANAVTLGALDQSLEVRLTPETRIDDGVRITAADSAGNEYAAGVERDAISTAVHDERTLGYYFSVPFECKPWSHASGWRLTVYVGKSPVAEAELAIPPKDLIVYEKATDNPFEIADVILLARGKTYKISYVNPHSDLLLVYYTTDYSLYAPIYAGHADPSVDPHSVPEITISARAPPGAYFFHHVSRSAVSGKEETRPVFGFKTIE